VNIAEVLTGLGDAPLAAVIVTEIGRDGTLSGPDIEGLAAVLASTSLPVIASGGVSTLADLKLLAGLEVGVVFGSGPVAGGAGGSGALGLGGDGMGDDGDGRGRRLAGVIVGKALYEHRFGVAEALAVLNEAA
jgi:phosphoribosylformimino-5-aminoimidazole carboxamide ribonucleotide (ProFAR) isomerase